MPPLESLRHIKHKFSEAFRLEFEENIRHRKPSSMKTIHSNSSKNFRLSGGLGMDNSGTGDEISRVHEGRSASQIRRLQSDYGFGSIEVRGKSREIELRTLDRIDE